MLSLSELPVRHALIIVDDVGIVEVGAHGAGRIRKVCLEAGLLVGVEDVDLLLDLEAALEQMLLCKEVTAELPRLVGEVMVAAETLARVGEVLRMICRILVTCLGISECQREGAVRLIGRGKLIELEVLVRRVGSFTDEAAEAWCDHCL